MPLKKGKSKKVVESNISELMGAYKKTGKIGNSKPASGKKAQAQAAAIAMERAGKARKKRGK